MAFDYSVGKCSGKVLREVPNFYKKNCNGKYLLEVGWLLFVSMTLSLLKVWWIHFENWKWNSRSSLHFKKKKLVKNGKILLKQWSVTTCTQYTLKKVHTSYSFPQQHHSLCHILCPKVWASIVYCWPEGKRSHTTLLVVKTHICEH
jgi:hypothetical protein